MKFLLQPLAFPGLISRKRAQTKAASGLFFQTFRHFLNVSSPIFVFRKAQTKKSAPIREIRFIPVQKLTNHNNCHFLNLQINHIFAPEFFHQEFFSHLKRL